MEVKTVQSNIYKFFKDQSFAKADGDTVKLSANTMKMFDIHVEEFTVRIMKGARWYEATDNTTGITYAIELQDNCMNVAKFNSDMECLDNTIYLSSYMSNNRYGMRRGNLYWGFSDKLIPETVPLSYLPSANEQPKDCCGLNSAFWHNNDEIIFPLYEADAQTMYVTKNQMEIMEKNPETEYVFIKSNDVIYGHGFKDITIETIDRPLTIEKEVNKMETKEIRYDVTEQQDELGLKDKVTEIAENMCCENNNCKLEKVTTTLPSQKEVFAYYSVSAVVLKAETGEMTDYELIRFDEAGNTVKDFYDLHPEIERPDERKITENEIRNIEEAGAPSYNRDLENEHTWCPGKSLDDQSDSFEEPF